MQNKGQRECRRARSSAQYLEEGVQAKVQTKYKAVTWKKRRQSRHRVAAAEKAEDRLAFRDPFYSSLPENPEEQREVLSSDTGHKGLGLIWMS